MKTILFFIIIFSISMSAHSQAPMVKMWDYRYGGDHLEYPSVLVQTLDHGFLICGHSNSSVSFDKSDFSRGVTDYWIVKTDSLGLRIWDKTFGGDHFEYFSSVIVLPDSGFLLGGYSFSGISGDKTQGNCNPTLPYLDFWIVRIDKLGNKIWDKTFGGLYDDKLNAMLLLADGSFLLGGTTSSDSSSDMSHHSYGVEDYWVLKIDSNGNKLWDFNYGGNGYDELNSICQTSDHGFILAGNSSSSVGICKSQSNINSSQDYWIVKIDSSGTELWDRTFGGNDLDLLDCILLMQGDNLLLGGVSSSGAGFDKTFPNHGNLNWDYWFIWIDNFGNKIMDKVYGGNEHEDELNRVTSINNSFLFSGTSYSNIGGDKSEDNILNVEQGWVIAVDSSGNKQWDKTIPTATHVEYSSGFKLNDGCYVFLSEVNSNGGDVTQNRNSDLDYWIVKYCPGNPPPVSDFISNITNLCQNTCVDFTNNSQNATSYQWIFPGGIPSSDTTQNPQGICYSNSGTYDVTLIATNNNGSDTLTLPNYISVYPQLNVSPITQNGDTLFSIPGYTSYQWYLDSSLIAGATNSYFIAPQSGDYSVLITDSNGCTALAKKLGVIASVKEFNSSNEEIKINYSSGILSLNINLKSSSSSQIRFYDILGKNIFSDNLNLHKGENIYNRMINNISSGFYFVEIINENKIRTYKIYIK